MTTDDPNPNPDSEDADANKGADDQSQVNDTGADEGDKGEDDSTALGGKAEADADKDGGEADVDKPAGAPEKYELKLPEDAPEGMKFDAEAFAAIEPTLKALNLPNEAAQQLVDAYAKEVLPALQKRTDDALAQTAADRRKEWDDAFTADPDIGGAKKAETITFAAKAFDFYGLKKGEGLRLLLDESGLGNHPDMIRFVARVGKDIGEDGFERGGPAAVPLTATEKFYGKDYGKQHAEQRS